MQLVEITIEELIEGDTINAFEFGYFLLHFQAIYAVCLKSINFQEIPIEEANKLVNSFLLEKGRSRSLQPYQWWNKDLPPEFDLEFVTISKQSPCKIAVKVTGASLLALTMAVILSGGEAELYTGKFKVPPIAKGIRELKNVFGQQQPRREYPSEKRLKSSRHNNKKSSGNC
jgi:hypothetical protein